MWLRWVVSNLLHQVAEQKLRQAVEQVKQPGPPDDSLDQAESARVPEPVSCDVVLVFALGIESGGLVDRLTEVVTTRCASHLEHVGHLDGRRVAIAESGVGTAAAAGVTEDVIKIHQPKWIVSTQVKRSSR